MVTTNSNIGVPIKTTPSDEKNSLKMFVMLTDVWELWRLRIQDIPRGITQGHGAGGHGAGRHGAGVHEAGIQ